MATASHPIATPSHRPLPPIEVHGLPHQLAWDVLCVHEPELRHVAMSIRRWRRSWRNYERAKQLILPLAGWFARNPRLRTCDAYSVAIDHVTKKVAP